MNGSRNTSRRIASLQHWIAVMAAAGHAVGHGLDFPMSIYAEDDALGLSLYNRTALAWINSVEVDAEVVDDRGEHFAHRLDARLPFGTRVRLLVISQDGARLSEAPPTLKVVGG